MPPTDACAYRWPNQQCSIDYWVEDRRDVTKAGEGGYVQRMELIVKRKKSRGGGGGGGGGVRVDVNGEVKLL